MSWLRRGRGGGYAAGVAGVGASVAAFWSWWAGAGAGRVTAAARSGEWGRVTGELTARVEAMDPGLVWEVGVEADGRVVLVVSGQGDPRLRALTERWRCAAPADGAVDFEPARPGTGQAGLGVVTSGGSHVDLSAARFVVEVDEDHCWLDVGVWHPQFSAVGAEAAESLVFMALDRVLGEDRVEAWLGGVEVVDGPAVSMVDAEGVQAAVGSLERAAGEPWWVTMSGRSDGGVLVVSARRPMSWVAFPVATLCVRVSLEYPDRGDGLPSGEVLAELAQVEDSLLDSVPTGVVHVVTVTGGGHRDLVCYAPPEADFSGLVGVAEESGATVSAIDDPGWSRVAQFR